MADVERLVSLCEGDDRVELQKLVSALTEDELIALITHSAERGKDAGAVIKAILKGSPPSTPEGVACRVLLYKRCIPLCESGDLRLDVVSDILGLLTREICTLPGPALAQLAHFFVEAIKVGSMGHGKSLELFPTILTALSATETLAYGKGELRGDEYRKQLINSLCSSRWDPHCVIQLTSMFRDVPLSKEELQFVVEKVLRMCSELDLQEIPPLAYQLLLLSAKGCKKIILEGLVSFFNELDQRQTDKEKHSDGADVEVEMQSVPQDQLRHVEGTTILHVAFAVQLDHELGRELLKSLKECQEGGLCPFSIALLLSVARIQRYKEQAFELLKTAVMRSLRDKQMRCGSMFVQGLLPQGRGVSHMILDTVRNSAFGWDHVTQGLVQLGFILMDSFGPKPGASGKASAAKSLVKQACQLGRRVLRDSFKLHEPIRGEILEQVLTRLVTKTSSQVSHFIELFSDIAVLAPMIILQSSSKVIETFDHLPYLPISTVQGLLQVIQPLMKVSVSLRDALILVLRKALFFSQLNARRVAVAGFLLLLKNFRVLGSITCSQASQGFSSSQLQVDVHARYNSAANESFCLEILGNLRRSLSQQAEVRHMLYEGFPYVLRRNSQLASSIMQILLTQLKRYYNMEQDLLPPVKLEQCISAQGETVFLQEPLAHLVSCAMSCLLWCKDLQRPEEDEEREEEGGFEEELQTILESVTRRMMKSNLEDFELDKSSDFSSSSIGVKNSIYAELVMGIYEVLIEYNYTTANYSKSRFEDLLQLFGHLHKLSEILREKSKTSRPARSMLSLGCVAALLTALFRDCTPSREESLSVLRSSLEFQRYAVGVAVQKVQQLEETGQTDSLEGHNTERTFRHLCDITSALMWRYTRIPSAVEEAGRHNRSKSVSLLCLEGLHCAFSLVLQRHPTRAKNFLSAIEVSEEGEREPEASNVTESAAFYIRQFQRALVSLLSGVEDNFNSREAQLLLSILGVLAGQLDPSSPQFVQMITWTVKITKETALKDMAFCKALLSLLFELHMLYKSPVTVLWELCQDIHGELGDIDQEVEVEKQSHFNIINIKTALPTALLVLTQVGRILDEVDWVIAKRRCQQSSKEASSGTCCPGGQQDPVEKAMTLQMGTLLTALNELVQTALPPGPCTDSLLRVLSRTYTVLTTLAKYYIQQCSSQPSTLPARMEKLVKLSGSHLTPQCYSFITYLQNGDPSAGAQKKEDMAAASARVLREAKTIPTLIFNIEQYERFLILLSKKSKVNLMQYMKLSISRDFRINAATVEAALQEQQESQQTAESQEVNETQAPQRKRRKP
ncbi:Fanconi anemia group I protein [Megalops cyprinoides]|uniref:Fanconi anemia group I protein n=1 Tax=Megalops cyprinoides TaxID=118141 RepID=UPI001864700B|nr:Fanconi anemia group I protein [Megalops cyprinoides]